MNPSQLMVPDTMNLSYIIVSVAAAVIVMSIHGFTMALVSHKLGDPLPKKNGLLTPNPLKHIEPVGLIMMAFFGYGWGKPVDTAAVYYKDKKQGTLLTNLVPCVIILLVGLVFRFAGNRYLMYMLGLGTADTIGFHIYIFQFLSTIAIYGVRMAVFNLIPVYPLDGAKVLSCFLSPNNVVKKSSYERIFLFVLVILLLWGIVQRILDPICGFLLALVP